MTSGRTGVRSFVTKGKVLQVRPEVVIFAPLGGNYQLYLTPAQGGQGAEGTDGGWQAGKLVDVLISAKARKIWTVASGGAMIVPIRGRPQIIQGRVRYLDEYTVVVKGGAQIAVELPSAVAAAAGAIDLNCGPIELGGLANITLQDGAIIEPAEGRRLFAGEVKY